MLGSDFDGEVLVAARKACALLVAQDWTWEQLLANDAASTLTEAQIRKVFTAGIQQGETLGYARGFADAQVAMPGPKNPRITIGISFRGSSNCWLAQSELKPTACSRPRRPRSRETSVAPSGNPGRGRRSLRSSSTGSGRLSSHCGDEVTCNRKGECKMAVPGMTMGEQKSFLKYNAKTGQWQVDDKFYKKLNFIPDFDHAETGGQFREGSAPEFHLVPMADVVAGKPFPPRPDGVEPRASRRSRAASGWR